MMQTSPSGPGLGALSLDGSPKGGGKGSGEYSDEFSQEFDKQVKNTKNTASGDDSGTTGTPSSKGDSTVKGKAKGDNKAPSGPAGESKQATSGKAGAEGQTSGEPEQAASDVEQGGKALPLEQMRKLAAELEGGEATDAEDGEATALLAEAGKTESEREIVPTIGQGVLAVADTPVDEPQLAEELSLFRLKQGGKDATLTAMMERQLQVKGGSGGDKGFEALLNLPGKAVSTASATDTLQPTLAPLAGQGASSPLATPVPVAMTLATPMHQANWGQAVAERVVWMTNANIQEAEIQLNPKELGPIGIKITVQNDQTNVHFVAQHSSTREALEAAIPRLREMLSENGLQLGQSDVSQHGFGGRDEAAAGGDGHAGGSDQDGLAEGDGLEAGEELLSGVGYALPSGVDAFA